MYAVNSKWDKTTRSLMKLNVTFIILVFLSALAACAIRLGDQNAGASVPSFFLRFAALPAISGFLLYLGGHALLRQHGANARLLQYGPVLLCLLLCFNVSLWYPDNSFCTAVFLFPLFLTVIFSDKRMSRLVTLCAVFLLALSDLLSLLFAADGATALTAAYIFRFVVSLCIYISAYMAACVIIESIASRDRKIEENIDLRNKLAEELRHDHLTGLYSVGTYEKLMIDFTVEAEANHTPLCMAVIDIDNFKNVNDNYGHAQGNVVLVALSELLQRHCSGREAVARYGGEEFVIFFPNTDVAVAFTKLDEMRKAFASLSFDFLPEGKHITFSTGLAAYPGNKYSNAFFFELADKAMYEAKDSGKNCICVQRVP